MKIALYLAILTTPTIAFQCFQCNNGNDEDDTKPCIDQVIKCPKGTRSCSTMLYTSKQGVVIHRRKFCTTSTSTSVPSYLRLIRNSVICQTISANEEYVQLTSLFQRQRREALPPAPPRQYKNNLLCICTTSLCNGGIHKRTIDRIFSNSSRIHNNNFSLQQLND